jgi:outer membrane receptor for Fe3+-dicitrate
MRRYADGKGQFRFAGVAEGSYDIRVRSVGYKPWVAHVDLLDGRIYEQDIALERIATALTEVLIEGKMVRVPYRYEDVYRRGAQGLGKLITREEIERQNSPDTKSLLQQIPGVLVNDRGITFQRCQAGLSGLSITPSRTGSTVSVQQAKVQVYIDGVLMTAREDAEHALRIVPPISIQAIEVYTGVAQIPAEFLSDACAVIAIWTKAY